MAEQDTTLTPTTTSVEPSSSSETVQAVISETTSEVSPVENTSPENTSSENSSVATLPAETSSATPAVPAWMNSVGVVPAPTSTPTSDSVPVAEQAEAKRGMFDAFKTGFLNNLQFLQKRKQQMAGITLAAPADSEASPVTDTSATSVATTSSPATPAVPTKLTDKEKKELLDAEKIYQNGLSSIRDLISPSSMEIRYDMIRVDGLFAQTFYVFTYPRYLDMNWMSPLINFEVSMDIAQFIYPIDSATIMKILRKKVTQMQSSIHMDQEKGKTRDPAIETALEDAEQLRTEIQRGQEKFFQFALYFTIYADDEKKIQNVAKQLESLLGGKLIMTRRAQIQAEQGFNSTLPISLDQLYVVRNMNTSPLSTTFPFTSSTLTSDEGILYGVNRHNDSLIIFDRFALENANSVVFAKSGAGKSYAVKLEITRMLMLGTDVIIIDPENEYEALAQTLGGTYLRLSLNSDRRINPFDLPPPLADDITQPGDILRQNVITLIGLLKVMLGEMTPVEEGILDKALIDVYALKGITMDVVDPSTFTPPTMEDLYDLLSTMEGASNLAQRLQKFTSGTYSGLFNKPTNLNLGTGLMVFCIRDLDEALRPIAMYIILNYIWAQVRRELKRRILVIDEAWSIMQHGDSARFLFGLVKRARKYYLGITTITQDVEDFFKSEYGKPIITNSSMQLLLKQAPAAMDYLGKVFNLTEGEKYILLNSGVGQGLFFAGNKHAAIQIIASYGEDQIVTTNPEQLLKKIQSDKQTAADATAVVAAAAAETPSSAVVEAEVIPTPAETPVTIETPPVEPSV
ncbi:MAG: DUF87 domain-containing protein [Candidatus Gracilibacteria bacterium]